MKRQRSAASHTQQADSAEQLLAQHRGELQERFPLPPPRAPRATGSKRGVQGALLLLLGAAGLFWLDPAYRSESHLSVAGQRQTLVLGDGSQVMLDADTRLRVDWHLRSRQVELYRGQVRFAVQRQPWRPFQVAAGALRVEVLGTTFSVRRQADQAQVVVAEGLVAVSASQGEGPLQLRAGEQVSASAGRLGTPSRLDAEAAMAWTQGRLVFARTPLGEALAQLRRYHAAPIRLGDPALAELQLSGVIATDRAATFLHSLPAILPVEVSELADGTVLIGRR